MPPAHAEFLRQSPRAPVNCPVLLKLDAHGQQQIMGEMIDVSVSGTAVATGYALRRGQRVTLIVDPDWFPAAEGRVLPILAGEVSWVRRDGERDSRAVYRIGVRFTSLPENVANHLRDLPHADRDATAPVDEVALAHTASGREQLYQIALVRLAAHDHDAARSAARASLRIIPHARHMRALLCRIDAEAALDGKLYEEARRRVAYGRGLAPEDPVWERLDERLDREQPPKPGLWTRLFRGG